MQWWVCLCMRNCAASWPSASSLNEMSFRKPSSVLPEAQLVDLPACADVILRFLWRYAPRPVWNTHTRSQCCNSENMLQNSTEAKSWSFVLKPHTLTLPGLAAVLFWGVWFAPEVPQDSLFWGFHQILPSAENETHTHTHKVRRGENSKGTNTKRKAGASATFGLAMHYALCIILTFERKPLAWILCPSFWQSENLWENKPCQCAQISSTQTLSPQKQLVLTGCRGKKEPEKQQKARSSPTPLCRSERPPPQWKRGNKRSLPAHETPLILLHTHYKDAHTEKKETKRGSRTVLLLGGLFHISVTYHWLWRYILFSLSSRPPQDRL